MMLEQVCGNHLRLKQFFSPSRNRIGLDPVGFEPVVSHLVFVIVVHASI